MNFPQEIKDAASVILLRLDTNTPKILMGKRSENAIFMPNKYVFPGGALEPIDYETSFLSNNQVANFEKLSLQTETKLGGPLLNCALRELEEETGIQIRNGDFSNLSIAFIVRAITPPGMSRRFDTRFFLLKIHENFNSRLFNNFRNASDELSDLRWISVDEALALDIPPITRNVILFVKSNIDQGSTINRLPFYREGSFQELTFL